MIKQVKIDLYVIPLISEHIAKAAISTGGKAKDNKIRLEEKR